jgi:hypothetical protein
LNDAFEETAQISAATVYPPYPLSRFANFVCSLTADCIALLARRMADGETGGRTKNEEEFNIVAGHIRHRLLGGVRMGDDWSIRQASRYCGRSQTKMGGN